MKNLLLATFVEWISQYWIIIALIICAVALLVPTYLRQKKEMNARNELNSTIKKGVKIITTAGVYGTVESIEETSDGKVVTIITGNDKNPTTMQIHINAIGGIDNKKPVVHDSEGNEIAVEEEGEVVDAEVVEEEVVDVEESVQKKPSTKKKSSTKTSSKK